MAFTTKDGKTQTVLAEINMIPFIDVVLVLLIIFMITAPVIQSGIEVDVPRTEVVKELADDLLTVTIDSKDTVYLQNDPVRVKEIAEQVKARRPALKDQKVYFQADRRVSWEITTAVIDALTKGDVKDIVIVTQPFEGKK